MGVPFHGEHGDIASFPRSRVGMQTGAKPAAHALQTQNIFHRV
jgi:hypothetical protein